jgi:O-antigen/teichoic acid export membrane protein
VLSKIKKLTSESIVYGLTNAVGNFFGIFLVPIYTRVFVPADYGVLDLVQVSSFMVIIFLTSGLDSAMFRYFYDTEDPHEKKKTISTIIFTSLIISLFICSLLILFPRQISNLLFSAPEYYQIIIVAIILIPLTLMGQMVFKILRLRFQAKWFAGLSIIGLLITISLTIYLVVFVRTGVIGVFIARIIGETFKLLSAVVVTRSNFVFEFDLKGLKEYYKFGLPLVPAALSQWAIVYLNRYILLFFTSLSVVGVYSLGYKISSFIMIITWGFQLAWSPFAFSIMNEPDAPKVYARVLRYFLLVTLSIAAFMTTFSLEIMKIFATPKYEAAYVLIGLLTASIICVGVYNIFGIGCGIEKKTIDFTKSLIIGAFINIIAGLILIPLFGMIGTAIAMLTGYIANSICMYLASQKYFYVPYEKKQLYIIAINFLILYLITVNFSSVLNPVKIIALCLFYIANYFLILNRKERDFVLNFAKEKILISKKHQ